MSNYILRPNGEFVSADELYHWGIKDQKWGVRRYQNKDGSLTPAGKKRLAKEISSRKISSSEAEVRMRWSVDSIKEFKDYRNSDKYRNAVRLMDDYTQSRREYIRAYDEARWHAAAIAERKYGRLEDLEYRGDTKTANAYRKEFDKHFDRRKIDAMEKQVNDKSKAAKNARESVQEDIRSLVDKYLGKYANTPLKGNGSAIWKGSKVVDRTRVNRIVEDAMAKELLFKSFSLEDDKRERIGFDFLTEPRR